MIEKTVLAAAVINFLEAEARGNYQLSAEKKEALQVAALCIKSSFEVSEATLNNPNVISLPDLMQETFKKPKVTTSEDRVRAEQHKTEGNSNSNSSLPDRKCSSCCQKGQ